MTDAQILELAWNALMEGRTADARAALEQSTTPNVRAFARRCDPNQSHALRDDLVTYGRMIGVRW